MSLLPHVDFVMVLGIQDPGRSGQAILAEAIDMARTLTDIRGRYHYEVMFDGGVKTDNVSRIPAKYVVAASGVLQSEDPVHSSFVLRSGGGLRRGSSAEPATAS